MSSGCQLSNRKFDTRTARLDTVVWQIEFIYSTFCSLFHPTSIQHVVYCEHSWDIFPSNSIEILGRSKPSFVRKVDKTITQSQTRQVCWLTACEIRCIGRVQVCWREWEIEIGGLLFMEVITLVLILRNRCRHSVCWLFSRTNWFSILSFPWHRLGVASITAEFGELNDSDIRLVKLLMMVNVVFTLHKHNLFVLSMNSIAGTFPIDTTKTRLQIQGQKNDQQFKKLRYSGMTDAFIKISRQEGVKALYSGWGAAMQFSLLVLSICDRFVVLAVFGQRFCGKQRMAQSNLAHTIRWKSSRPKKAFCTIATEMNVSGAMFYWL